MGRRLAFDVLVRQKDGTRERVPAGTPDSDARTKGVTNAAAWDDDPQAVAEAESNPAKKAPAKRASRKASKAAPDAAPAGADAASAGVERPADDADAAAWTTYAASLGQDVPEGADRDAIVEQLATAGLLES